MRSADWYFDFISPFAYLAWARLAELPRDVAIRRRPVLLAGLLNHWGQKGPAEIAAKRLWTYRWCMWQAAQQSISFRFPAAHPFNPLPYLRLAIAAGNTQHAIHAIFQALWTTGADPADERVLDGLLASLNVSRTQLTAIEVKDALRLETQRAVERGVFGVPTLAIDGQLFWGADALAFLKAYLADPGILVAAEMQRVATLPVGAVRKFE
jgi:2-hydroxychromene-2-carboxylate isomerase